MRADPLRADRQRLVDMADGAMIDIPDRASGPAHRTDGVVSRLTGVVAKARLVALATRTSGRNGADSTSIGVFPAEFVRRVSERNDEHRPHRHYETAQEGL